MLSPSPWQFFAALMPPCAAMLCARRGLSWKQKLRTLYPSSASVAAAAPPASPVPTTMMSYFRLLAGFTSLSSKRCFVHFSSIGPLGIFAFSSIALPYQAGQNCDRERDDREHDHQREDCGDRTSDVVVLLVVRAQRLQHAPEAVVQMQAERDHRRNVGERHRNALEADDEVVVDVAVHEVGVCIAEREVQQVVDHEQEDDDTAPLHRA